MTMSSPADIGTGPPPPNATQREVSIPVRFAGGSGHLAGTLTVPDEPTGPMANTVQLLVHGYSYSRYYWDFPYQPETYSYVHAAARAGYPTLAIDRLGDGRSSRPAGRLLTWQNAALTVATAVTALRRGSLGTTFDKVILVGHSYGSVTCYQVAARHPGVDALIITGAAHRVNLLEITRLLLNSPPALGSLAEPAPDPLYVTTRRDWRDFLYRTANADPEVIALDERLKQTAGVFEVPSALPYLWNGVSRTTNIPSLTVIGDHDQVFAKWAADCSSDAVLAAFERRFYGPLATVEGAVIRGAGHDLNLERTAPETYARMLGFCAAHS
jgi:pimeloyl-ACP methyl ester carboxylesterase